MATVDPPDRIKPSDDWLDWLSAYRLDWEDRYFKLEQTTLAIALYAETMVNGDQAHRRAMHNAIQLELRDAGLTSPEPEGTEPTA